MEEVTIPKASIIIPCFNAQATVERAIASAVTQCDGDVEILAVDDWSTDDTPLLLSDLASRDSRVTLLHTKANAGPGGARNVGLEHAGGDWVAMLDADDYFLPDRLSGLIESASENGLGLAFDNMTAFDPRTGHPWRDLFPAIPTGIMDWRFFLKHANPLGRWRPGILKPVIQRSFLGDTRYRDGLRYGEDMTFAAMLLLKGPAYFCDIPRYRYSMSRGRQVEDQFSKTSRQTERLLLAHNTLLDWARENCASNRELIYMVERNCSAVKKRSDWVRFRELVRIGKPLFALRLALRSPFVIRIAWSRALAALKLPVNLPPAQDA